MFVNPSSLPPVASGGAQPPPNIRGKMTIPSTTIELSVRCADLSDRDLMSNSDPVCIMYQKVGGSKNSQWREVAKTELVENCLNP